MFWKHGTLTFRHKGPTLISRKVFWKIEKRLTAMMMLRRRDLTLNWKHRSRTLSRFSSSSETRTQLSSRREHPVSEVEVQAARSLLHLKMKTMFSFFLSHWSCSSLKAKLIIVGNKMISLSSQWITCQPGPWIKAWHPFQGLALLIQPVVVRQRLRCP